jgi:polyphosphate kinase 2 (PPK2 family)
MKKLLLGKVDLTQRIEDDKSYERQINEAQLRLLRLQAQFKKSGQRAMLVFEGWDASGKGGAIKRMIEVLDPRQFRVWPIAAPYPRDQSKHYLYRFWEKLPDPSNWAFFDRSWYGRVLVERIEGFATKEAWQRSYREINEFERLLTDDGVTFVKLFFHVSRKEQLRRLKAREENELKVWKVTDEDWRNRRKWNAYVDATHDMFDKTSTKIAPWHLIAGENKKFARVSSAEIVADTLEKAL